jgi:pyruvate dehydrogenase E2 component (dihydrolipoamide acetyltransferase)
MSERVTMPALGESVTEGTVTRWLKSVGDSVEVDEPLLEVSTDKVDTEIPSPVAGVLEQILVEEDETVEVGADLAVIGDGSGSGDASDGSAQQSASADAEGPADEVEDPADAEAVKEAGDEGGQEPAEPQTDEEPQSSSNDSDEQKSSQSSSSSSGAASGGGSGEGTTVPMPALGESVTEGTVTRWLKAEGDQVEVDEPLLEVSTDKVDTEIPSPVAGTLTKILVQEDETVPVGADLAIVGGSSDSSGSAGQADEPAQDAEPEKPSTEKEPEEEQQKPQAEQKGDEEPEATSESGSDQSGDEDSAKEDSSDGGTQESSDQGSDKPAGQRAEASTSTATAPQRGDDTAVSDAAAYVTPLVRKIAADNDIDLTTVKGTGVGGRIRKQDVLAAAEAARKPEPAPDVAPAAASSTPASAPTPAGKDAGLRGTTQPMTRLRKTIARRMVESLQTSAQLTTVVEVDVTKIARLRDRAKAEFERREGTKLSFLPFFAVAAVESLKAHPTVNASIDGDSVTYHGAEHLGMAVDTDKGLIVPVVKNAGDLNIAGIARAVAEVAERTRSNKIMPDDLAGGTFTITNTGSRGALFDTPIINQPQVAILGTGAVVKRPVVVKDADGGETIAIRSMVYLALSYDHRIVDGADAARFLSTMKERLEEGAFEADLGL